MRENFVKSSTKSLKLQILSDLHIDAFHSVGEPVHDILPNEANIILVAGDTGNGLNGLDWLINQASRLQKPIYTVLGNHEYYHGEINACEQKAQEMTKDTRVTVLQKTRVDLTETISLLGCTLWTDFQYNHTPTNKAITQYSMNDFRLIHYLDHVLSIDDTISIHKDHLSWLLTELAQLKSENKKVIVMTHHGISPLSIAPQYKNSSLNMAFISDLSPILASDIAPILWIHGHTHESFNYKVGHCQVVVNPKGYPFELKTGDYFDNHKILVV